MGLIVKLYDKVTQQVIDLLSEDDKNIRKIASLIENNIRLKNVADKKQLYVDILKLLTHLDFSGDEAEEHWHSILEHHADLEKKLDRKVGLRVAMLDYFINVNKRIENPKIIEISLFEETVLSAFTDELTGLYNRKYFQDVLFREFYRAKRYGLNLSLIFIDVDDFKKFNDTYGHAVGDQVLKDVGTVLKNSTRDADIPIRYGGEEFIVLLPETDSRNALVVAERIRTTMENFYEGSKNDWIGKVTLSLGISGFPVDAHFPEELVEKGDMAMYHAKKSGKNQVCIFFQEKRIFPRFKVKYKVKYEILDESQLRKLALSEDMSGGGVLFSCDEEIAPSTKLRVIFELETGKNIKAIGEVVRSSRLTKSKWDIGLKFLEINPLDRAALIKCLKESAN